MEDGPIGLVEIDSLLDDALVVTVERNAGGALESPRTLETTGLHIESIVVAVAVRVLPLTDRIAQEGWRDFFGHLAPISVDPAKFVHQGQSDICHLREYDDLHCFIYDH